MIVIVSHPDDPHAARVLEHLRAAKQDVTLLDLSDLPRRARMSIDYAQPASPAIEFRGTDGRSLCLHEAHAVWWRRPQAPEPLSGTSAAVQAFAANEWQEAINGLWPLIDGHWMNPPLADERAGRKAWQLRVAAECGLTIPRTLISSDPDRARAFILGLKAERAIFKTFSATHEIWRETRLVGESELAMLDSLRFGPVIFQEYVPGDADLRITAVGDALYTAAIHAADTDYPYDFRMSLGQARVEPADLPVDVAARLRRLLDRLGLVYGAIDMRLRRDGTYVFLEVNTAGEFLFIEERTGQPISRAVADWLARPDAR